MVGVYGVKERVTLDIEWFKKVERVRGSAVRLVSFFVSKGKRKVLVIE